MTCRTHQWRISRALDEGAELPTRTAEHLRRCEACREFQRRCMELHGRLAAEAADELPSVSPELHGRILAAAEEAPAAEPAPRVVRFPLRWAVPAAAAAVAALALLAVWLLPPGKPTTTSPMAEAKLGDQVLAAVLDPASLQAAGGEVIELALASPIDREARALDESGRAAGRFLLELVPFDLGVTGPRTNGGTP